MKQKRRNKRLLFTEFLVKDSREFFEISFPCFGKKHVLLKMTNEKEERVQEHLPKHIVHSLFFPLSEGDKKRRNWNGNDCKFIFFLRTIFHFLTSISRVNFFLYHSFFCYFLASGFFLNSSSLDFLERNSNEKEEKEYNLWPGNKTVSLLNTTFIFNWESKMDWTHSILSSHHFSSFSSFNFIPYQLRIWKGRRMQKGAPWPSPPETQQESWWHEEGKRQHGEGRRVEGRCHQGRVRWMKGKNGKEEESEEKLGEKKNQNTWSLMEGGWPFFTCFIPVNISNLKHRYLLDLMQQQWRKLRENGQHIKTILMSRERERGEKNCERKRGWVKIYNSVKK